VLWVLVRTPKNVVVKLRHPDGTRDPLVIGTEIVL
jgi:hypothetical protein